MPKKTSSSKTGPSKKSPQAPLGGDAVLVPGSLEGKKSKQSDYRLIATLGPDVGVGLPVFTLVPQRFKKGKSHAGAVSRPARHRTRDYGGHRLIVSGSMSDEVPGPPSFTLTLAKKTQAPSKPNTEKKRKK